MSAAPRGPVLVHDTPEVRAMAERASSGGYVDVHNRVLTPHHLRLLLSDLVDLGYLSVRGSWFHPTVGFFLNLRRGVPAQASRRDLLRLSTDELRTLDGALLDEG